jgi:hypothetical protein
MNRTIIQHQNLESLGTIIWFLMDFVWMCGYNRIALALAIPAIILLIGACVKYNGKSKSELYALTASVFWFLMNFCWISSEIIEKDAYLIAAKLSFFIGCVFLFLTFRASRKEKEPVDFKRLKIK